MEWQEIVTWLKTVDLTLEDYILCFLGGCLVGHILYWGFLCGRTVKIFGREIEL